MHIRTFRAASLQDALEEIRQAMGSNASVLHTRQVRDGWRGWLGRTYVEVTAGIEEDGSAANRLPTSDATAGQPVDPSIAANLDTTSGPPVPVLPIESRQSDAMLTDSRNIVGGIAGANTQVANSGHPATNQRTGAPLNADGPSTLPMQSAETDGLPLQLHTCRSTFLNIGVPKATVDRWITTTTSFAATLGDLTAQPWLEHLQRTVARELRFGGPIRIPPGTRHVVALVGPTGVGKTTTIAKLAAGFRLESKRRVGLLTIDTFRIAAVQQLKAYAEIMDLPMQVVEQPGQMRSALETLGDVDLVLIDTAGRSPRSDARIDQLVDLLRSAQPDETHLVLSAASSTSSIHTILKGFAPARPTAAILTKLDEAPHTAGVLSALTTNESHCNLPVSYVTNGQQVPDDISVADASILLQRLLPAPAAISHLNAA